VITSRASGVQLHITSLPDGRLGPSARAFVDWLAAAGQSVWQVLPVSVPDEFRSPYKSPSAFAASPALLEHPGRAVSRAELDAFAEREAYWVQSWTQFGQDLADQVRFAREWAHLRAYAAERGIRIMGDVPIYVAPDGADERAWPQFFRRDAVAGCPPDAYAATGQLWGNPLYRWDAIADDGYRWWIERLRRTFSLFDLVRLDHFRGFVEYWAVPAGEPTAANGRWRQGPGRALFDAVRRELGDVPLVAEDLGTITPDVRALLEDLGIPGMKVLQFAFYGEDTYLPHRHVPNAVVYTGTHDNDTARGWWAGLTGEERARVRDYLGSDGAEIEWDLIRAAYESVAQRAIVPVQDVFGLGSEARMNTPGEGVGSWSWRAREEDFTPERAARLRRLAELTGR
jgi:4-alpha-glucanotransferase